jgi:hypothetical protein
MGAKGSTRNTIPPTLTDLFGSDGIILPEGFNTDMVY